MNRILIVLITLLAFGCESEQKNNRSELESVENTTILTPKKTQPNIVLDTLIFDKDMDGELLAEKYDFGSKELKYYKQFVFEDKVNDKQILAEKTSKTEITYLGKLMDLDNQHSYHVITHFKIIGIGEMLSPRGISNIAFLNDGLDKLIIYRMAVPDELPEKIENNILYFQFKNEKIGISISGGLPPMLCLPRIGCN